MTGTHYNAFVMGTATWDRVVKRSGAPGDTKSVRIFRYEQAGGSAVNTRTAFGALANANNATTTVWACMKLGETGPGNPYKDKLLREIGDHHLMDPAFREERYTISDNDIMIWNDPDTGNVKRCISKAQDDIETPIFPGIDVEIRDAVAQCDVVILNSRFPEIAMIAADEAKKNNIPVILDYAETNLNTSERCEPLVRMADYILADADAVLPGMDGKNPDELRRLLVEKYGCESVAVSENRHPIKVYAEGHYADINVPLHDVAQVDNLGTGDIRDGAFGYYIADGRNFLSALICSSVIASHSVGYPGHTWIGGLPGLIATHPVFAESQTPPSDAFTRAAAPQEQVGKFHPVPAPGGPA